MTGMTRARHTQRHQIQGETPGEVETGTAGGPLRWQACILCGQSDLTNAARKLLERPRGPQRGRREEHRLWVRPLGCTQALLLTRGHGGTVCLSFHICNGNDTTPQKGYMESA